MIKMGNSLQKDSHIIWKWLKKSTRKAEKKGKNYCYVNVMCRQEEAIRHVLRELNLTKGYSAHADFKRFGHSFTYKIYVAWTPETKPANSFIERPYSGFITVN